MVIDPNIAIDYLRNYEKAVHFIQTEVNTVYLSVISIAELYAGVFEGKEKQMLKKFLSHGTPLEITTDIAEVGGLWRRDYGKSHNVSLNDALIAAQVHSYKLRFATLNQKHFPMLKELIIPYKY